MSEWCLDHELAKKLASLVEKMTKTGSLTLDTQLLKEFKKICRTSDLYIERAYHLLMAELSREHAEIRLSAFQIIDELFHRSHAFRELLVSDFQTFLELTVETDQHHQPLPPPKAAATKLKTDTLKAVQQWQDKFGTAYKKLALGYKFLKTCRHVNFNSIRARTLAEQQRFEEQERRKQMALAAKLEKVRKEFSEMQKELSDSATEAENCIELLLPKPDHLFTESDFGVGDSEESNHVHAIPQPATSSSHGRTIACTSNSGTRNRDINAPTSKEGIEVQAQTTDTSLTNPISAPTASSCSLFECSDNQLKQIDCSVSNNLQKHSDCTDDKQKHEPTETTDTCGCIDNQHKLQPAQTDTSQATTSLHPADDPCNNCDGVSNDSDDEADDFEDVDADAAEEEQGVVRTHGLGTRKYQLQIEIGAEEVRLTETEDNRDLFRSLRDSSCLVSMRYLPQVIRWLEVLSKTGGSQAEIKAMIDLKLRLENIKSKCADLQVVPDPSTQLQQSDSDEEMEEVPEKEGYEALIPAHRRAEYGLDPNPSTSKQTSSPLKGKAANTAGKKQDAGEMAGGSGVGKAKGTTFWNLNERNQSASFEDPTSRAATMVKLGLKDEARPSTSKGTESSVTGDSDVPTLPFGLDLAFWGTADKVEAPAIVKNDSLHRFWVPAEVENENPSQNDIAVVMNRTFHYTGEFVPVKWKCRAKLPNGKLCERMDRVKCPFHGKIVPRDEQGCPTNPNDIKKEAEEAGETNTAVKVEPKEGDEQEVKPWLDAELQAEIEAATGHDLGSQRSKAKEGKGKGPKGKGKGKGKKSKEGGLTNIKESRNTTRARLEAKVFSKRALKRVADVLDAADYKRVRDKFGNQFNYSIKN